jgi:hypothetical protein
MTEPSCGDVECGSHARSRRGARARSPRGCREEERVLMPRRLRSLRRLAGPVTTALVLMATVPAVALAAAPYQSPFEGDTYLVGRTDMGVDVCLHHRDPIRAVGDGVVTGVIHNWFSGQPYLWYELTGGPQAGHYVYVAEQINHRAHVGQRLAAGQPVARFARRGTCIETGWSSSDGSTMAQATTGYHEGQVTKAGVAFARFLMGVGVDGDFELHPTHPHPHGHGHGHRHA